MKHVYFYLVLIAAACLIISVTLGIMELGELNDTKLPKAKQNLKTTAPSEEPEEEE